MNGMRKEVFGVSYETPDEEPEEGEAGAPEQAEVDAVRESREKELSFEEILTEKRQEYAAAYRTWANEPKADAERREALRREMERADEEYKAALRHCADDFYFYDRQAREALKVEGVEGPQLEKRMQAAVFDRFVSGEAVKLQAAKAEALPPKERGIARKLLTRWAQLPRAARWAISAGIATGVTLAGSGIVAGGAAGALIAGGMTLGKKTLSVLTTLASERLIALGFKGWDRWVGKEKTREYRVGALRESEDIVFNLDNVRESYARILEETARRERRRNVAKFAVSVGAGIGSSFLWSGLGASEAIGKAARASTVTPEHAAPAPPDVESAGAEPTIEVTGIGEEHLDYQGGDSIWREIEYETDNRDAFEGLFDKWTGNESEAYRTHFIDYLKDKVYEQPAAYGVPEGADLDHLTEAELRQVDWDKLFNELSSPDEMKQALPHLTDGQIHSILESNERMRELAQAQLAQEAEPLAVTPEAPPTVPEPVAPVPSTDMPLAGELSADALYERTLLERQMVRAAGGFPLLLGAAGGRRLTENVVRLAKFEGLSDAEARTFVGELSGGGGRKLRANMLRRFLDGGLWSGKRFRGSIAEFIRRHRVP